MIRYYLLPWDKISQYGEDLHWTCCIAQTGLKLLIFPKAGDVGVNHHAELQQYHSSKESTSSSG